MIKMTAKQLAICGGILLCGLVVGISIDRTVFADQAKPGSASDPLAARSYVDQQTKAYVAGLEQKVAILNTRAQQLEQALAVLQKQAGVTPIQVGSGGSTTTGTSAVNSGGTSTGTTAVNSGSTSTGTTAVNSGSTSTGTTAVNSGGTSSQSGAKYYIKSEYTTINLRTGPGTNFPLAGSAKRGSGCEPLTLISSNGGWYQVKLTDGRVAWVAGWLVRE